MDIPKNDNEKIEHVPLDIYIQEGASQCERMLQDVMTALYERLPDHGDKPNLTLADGTKCRLVKFSEPQKRDGHWTYGFDVQFQEGHALNHIEFSVGCSGWERPMQLAEE